MAIDAIVDATRCCRRSTKLEGKEEEEEKREQSSAVEEIKMFFDKSSVMMARLAIPSLPVTTIQHYSLESDLVHLVLIVLF